MADAEASWEERWAAADQRPNVYRGRPYELADIPNLSPGYNTFGRPIVLAVHIHRATSDRNRFDVVSYGEHHGKTFETVEDLIEFAVKVGYLRWKA